MLALKQKQLFDEIDILPIELKTKIVDKILTSMNYSNNLIDDLWVAEVNQRKNDIENSKLPLVDGDEVFIKIAKKLHK